MMKARDAEVINAYIGGASIAALAQRFLNRRHGRMSVSAVDKLVPDLGNSLS